MSSHSVFMVSCIQHLLLVVGVGLFSIAVLALLLLLTHFDLLVDVFCVDMLWFEEFSCYGQLVFGGSSQPSSRWTQIHMYSVAAFRAASIARKGSLLLFFAFLRMLLAVLTEDSAGPFAC